MRRIENEARIARGKGWGSGTVSQEVAACLSQLSELRSRGLVVLDIGANAGNWTAALLKALPQATVFAFEPSAAAHDELSARFQATPNVGLVKAAVGSKKGVSLLWADEPGSGHASLTKRNLRHLGVDFNHSENVNVVTLDEWCELNNVSPVLVKIDVEGHELDVLSGAVNILKSAQVVQFEFGGCNIDTRTYFKDFFYFFDNLGFLIKRITRNGLVDVPKYREADECFQITNFIAVSQR